METRQWTFIDKTTWDRGPWDSEPDKAQWIDETTGYPCLIVRNRVGALCGYVGVAERHKLFGIDYAECSLPTAKPRGVGPEDTRGGTPSTKWFAERLAKRRVCNKEYCRHRPVAMVEVHGGLTFSNFCREDSKEHGICHVVEEGENDRVWWLGFDCAHGGDLMPSERMELLEVLGRKSFWPSEWGDSYRDLAYVKAECAKLARQLREME